MESVLVAVIVGLGAIAFFVGRWWILVLPFAVVPIFSLGLDQGWRGSGVGDGWQYVMVFVLALAVGAVAVGLAGRALTRRR